VSYAAVKVPNVRREIRIALHWLSKRSTATGVVSSANRGPWAARLGLREPSPREWHTAEAAEWVAPAGWTTGGAEVFVVTLHRASESYEVALYHFLSHFDASGSPLEFYVDGRALTAAIVEKITKFTTSIGAEFATRVRRVSLFRLSIPSAEALQKFTAPKWIRRVRIVEDLEAAIGEDQVFLKKTSFDEPTPLCGFILTTAFGKSAKLLIARSGFSSIQMCLCLRARASRSVRFHIGELRRSILMASRSRSKSGPRQCRSGRHRES
jgi:hypothetical protein